MNKTRRFIAGSYHLFMVLSTLIIPLLIYYGTRGQGTESFYGTVGAVLAFVILLAYLIIPNLRQSGR
ncbi:hypothetical protein [Melghirimyces algeriensis]|uniref:Uncharacterized protein n=1 Tax=Melghirimyces algeriensis TaxID=910412 RepID=A0A521EFF7_9BACL|nr:hypothetical protein [Melghirimyces algeriensis]SMO82676.1 hypothetical protein SAMN06264849_10920 [Melghirimyces algeriensis]